MLTGRVDGMTGELRLDEDTDEYLYLGLGVQRARLRDYGFFIADTWRWKPNLTFNLGLRYELQPPFYPRNNSYSTRRSMTSAGVSGVAPNGGCNLFQPGVQPGSAGSLPAVQRRGKRPTTPTGTTSRRTSALRGRSAASGGLLGSIFGREEGDSVLRAGYTLGYNRPGMSDFTGAIDDNPGISQTANRNHTLGNLGTRDVPPPQPGRPWAAAELPGHAVYPMTDVVTGDIMTFDPNLQVPYSQTWTAGWQRKLTATSPSKRATSARARFRAG